LPLCGGPAHYRRRSGIYRLDRKRDQMKSRGSGYKASRG
jgi:hypothetical protein